MKKFLTGILVIFLTAGLVGCANSSKDKSKSSSVKSSKVVSSKSKKSSSSSVVEEPVQPEPEEQTALWNPDKTAQLRAFMDEWQKTRSQFDAADYSKGVNVKLYGADFPKILVEKDYRTEYQGKDIRVSWSTDGISGDGYNIVGCYSDDAHATIDRHYLYLFTIINRQPVILVTSQNQGNERHSIVFEKATNEELNAGFSKIVNS